MKTYATSNTLARFYLNEIYHRIILSGDGNEITSLHVQHTFFLNISLHDYNVAVLVACVDEGASESATQLFFGTG